jgi:uncharacterized protein YcbX
VAGRVEWISIAPVKGLGLVSLDAAELTEHGVPENRRFHVIDARGRLCSGKRHGPLVRVRPRYDAANEWLALDLPGGGVAEGPADALGDGVVTVFYGRPVRGHLVEGPFAGALSEVAGEPLRLVRPEQPGAAVDRGRGGAVSLVTTAALHAIADAAGCDGPLDGRRFRMLLGVAGLPPHAEDGWIGSEVRVGGAVVVPRGHVGRCTITAQDPDTGVRDLDTLAAIRAYRGEVESTEPLPFGVHGRVAQPGTVRVGDPVEPA